MKLDSESGRDFRNRLQVRLRLAPLFGTGGKEMIKTTGYTNH